MMRKSFFYVSFTAGVSVLALTACDRTPWDQGDVSEINTSSDASSEQIACIDPATGELLKPGPDVDCRIPTQAKAKKGDPVVRDLEGGGKAIDLRDKVNQNKINPASQGMMAAINPETGELTTPSPGEVKDHHRQQ